VASPIWDKNNPEFVGDQSKFKYLAIHGYERWQVDKEGKSRSGKSSEWIKDYCRKDSDPDFSQLTMLQRATLDGLRRLAGLHGQWPHNDVMWVSRALCALPKERAHVSQAVRTLVSRGLVDLSNERLGSLEVVDKRREDHLAITVPGAGPGVNGDHMSLIDSEAKAAPKAKPSVPKIQGKISVKPAPISPPARPVPDGIKGSMSEYLANAWRYYKLPGEAANLPLWSQLIEDYAFDVVQVLRWAMFINKDRYWLNARINSVVDFARCFSKMHEQYLKCGGPELEKALEFADDKYCSEHQDHVMKVAEQYGGESFQVEDDSAGFQRVCLEDGCTSRLVVEPGQTKCRQCRGVKMCSNCGRRPIEDPEGRYPTWCTDCIDEQEFGVSNDEMPRVQTQTAFSEPRLCSECALDYADEGQELCLQCRLATVEVSETAGLD
jgi:hypothetical protein